MDTAEPRGATSRAGRVLIVGCGELGSRHLQAVASLPQVAEIEVVDPRPEALAQGRERLAEVSRGEGTAAVRWLASLDEASPAGGLCIVATQADVRCAVTRQVAERLGYTAFLLEKLVAQSIEEGDALLEVAGTRGLAIWVNCKTRAYPFHQRVKQRLDPREPIIFTAVAGNHGLASNGIHDVDLFAFYDEATVILNGGCRIDPIAHRTKRGLWDLSGTLQGYTEKGSHLTVSYAADHQASDCLFIGSRRYRCLVDHMNRWAVEAEAETGWVWRPVPFEGNLLVSAMTQTFASDILAMGRCQLPTLGASLVAHRFVLGALQPAFSRLLERAALCPVT